MEQDSTQWEELIESEDDDEETLEEKLVDIEEGGDDDLEELARKIITTPRAADELPNPNIGMSFRSKGKGKGGLSGNLGVQIISKLAPMLAGAPPSVQGLGYMAEGGYIKKAKKKKKRYVRGCGAAKRGFGKANYSKKMY